MEENNIRFDEHNNFDHCRCDFDRCKCDFGCHCRRNDCCERLRRCFWWPFCPPQCCRPQCCRPHCCHIKCCNPHCGCHHERCCVEREDCCCPKCVLKAPCIKIDHKVLKWDKIECAAYYQITIFDGCCKRIINVKDNCFFLNELNDCNKVYHIKVMAIACDPCHISSCYSNIVCYKRMNKPILRCENRKLVWDKVEYADRYRVLIDNGNNLITKNTSSDKFIIKDEYFEGKKTVKCCVMGESDCEDCCNSEMSEELEVLF